MKKIRMDAIRLETHTHQLKRISNVYSLLRMLSYENIEEHNKCEYYYKLFPAWRINFIKGQPVDISVLIEQPPTEVSYSSDGTYLRIGWDAHVIMMGKYPSCGVKTYVSNRTN